MSDRTPLNATLYEYNAANQVVKETKHAGIRVFEFDLNGNQTGSVSDSGRTEFVWSVSGKLKSIGSPQDTELFSYDTQGLRVGVFDSVGQRRYVFDGMDEYMKVSAADRVRYDRDVSSVDAPIAFVDSIGKQVYVRDALGSPYATTNQASTRISDASYDVFGQRTKLMGSLGDADFSGRIASPSDGNFLNLRLRVLERETGRFLSADPLGFVDGQNLYSYVHDRPAVLVDPLGLATSLTAWTEPINNRINVSNGAINGVVVPIALKILKTVALGEYPRHTYLELKCNEQDCAARGDLPSGFDPPFDLRIDGQGPVGPTGTIHLNIGPFTIDQNSVDYIEEREWIADNWGKITNYGITHKCGLAACLIRAARSYQFPQYNPIGPNSNTFAAQVTRACGVWIFFNPETEPGWDWYGQ